MDIYKTIRETRKIIDSLYNTQTHEVTRRMLGVSSRFYKELRYYNIPSVAEQIDEETYHRLKDFLEVHKLPKEQSLPVIEEPIKPRPPVEVFVDNDIPGPNPVKLEGKSLDLVNAMAKLREAMEPFYNLGYNIGLTLYRRNKNE